MMLSKENIYTEMLAWGPKGRGDRGGDKKKPLRTIKINGLRLEAWHIRYEEREKKLLAKESPKMGKPQTGGKKRKEQTKRGA